MDNKKTKVLLEMRPALEGFAGIPQEVRLLFRGLAKIPTVEVEGMLQTSHRVLARGLPNKRRRFFARTLSEDRKINRYSRVIISMAEKPYRTVLDMVVDFFQKRLNRTTMTLNTLLIDPMIRLTKFESQNFQDFVWRTMFSKTLPASDFDLVTRSNFQVNYVPWHTLHMVGLNTLTVLDNAKYPKLDVSGFDIFIGQTPYPATFGKGAKVVIRYHDAIPIFMPHTISDKSIHQATHYHALKSNVKSGAWFACVSDATRRDLISLFPEAAKRSVVIHNMVSHHYFPEDSPRGRVPGIIRSRYYGADPDAKDLNLSPKFLTLREQENFFLRNLPKADDKYLLIVSTIEPRKNHGRLLAAWEVIKSDIDPNIKLVVVGTLGWDYKQIFKGFKTWIDRGELFMLNSVPAPDLRVLYRHAAATVCPSLGEGFDFSGVESMACGGVTVASDIPVHREVYEDAAEYFDPYSTMSLVKVLKKVLYDPDAEVVRKGMIERSSAIATRYQPGRVIPQWENFLKCVVESE